MKSESWDEYVDTIATGLRGLEATDRSGASLPAREAVTLLELERQRALPARVAEPRR